MAQLLVILAQLKIERNVKRKSRTIQKQIMRYWGQYIYIYIYIYNKMFERKTTEPNKVTLFSNKINKALFIS